MASSSGSHGLKGRYREGDGIYKDPKALGQTYKMQVPDATPGSDRLIDLEIDDVIQGSPAGLPTGDCQPVRQWVVKNAKGRIVLIM
jgi:hypothetical protein